ncbi:palmitoyl-(protein) hydrolase [Aureococcus anophagefferens]|nr:palmitoyl-(protein) hydrolase [Aureococcus anophagefferens]
MTRYLAFHAATAEGVVDASPLPTSPPLARTWRARFPNAAACARQGKAPGRLVLLVRLWTDELRRCVMSAAADDGGITRLAYVQARACVMMDLWPCPLEDAALAAEARASAPPLSLARDGTAGAPPLDVGESPRPRLTPSVSLVRSKLGSLLPERVLKSRESGEWELDVLVELGFRLNDPHASAASDYLAIVETWDSFGTVAFSGYVLSPKLGDAAPGGKRGPRDKSLDWAEDPPAHKYVRPAAVRAAEAAGRRRGAAAGGPPAPPAVDTARCAGTDEGADRDLERSSTPPPPERDGGDDNSEKPAAPAAATELAGRPPQKSVGTYLNNLYDSLVFAIIRPPRSVYDERRLGPTSFAVDGAGRFHRRDVRLRNVRGEELRCSHWVPEAYGDGGAKRPCVIFMHANSAARVQALHYVSLVLSLGCTFFSFDCAGSGLSDGTYVSLGWRESRDLHVVARYLRRLGTVSSLGAWGCSMGAASIIFYLAASGDTTHMEKLTRRGVWRRRC